MRIISPFRFEDLQCGDPVWSADYGHGELEPISHSTGERVVRFLNREMKTYYNRGIFGSQKGDEESLIWPALTFERGATVLEDSGGVYRVSSVVRDKDTLYPIHLSPIEGGVGRHVSVTPSGHSIADECREGCFWPVEGGRYPKFYAGMPVMQVNTKEMGEVFCIVEYRQTLIPVGVRWDSGGKEYFTIGGQGIINGPRVIFPLEKTERIPQSSGINGNNRGKSMISTDLKSITNEVEIGFWRGVGEKLPSILLSQGPRILSAIAREYGGKGNSEADASAEIVKKLISHPAISKIIADLDKQ